MNVEKQNADIFVDMTTTIIITAGNKQPIGACESLTIKESKTEDNSTTSVKLEIPRMRLDRSRLSETFERGHFHVASQVYPIHITVLEDGKETIHVHNVWISGIAAAFTTDEWIIAEGLELEAESVKTIIQEA